jgi:hypothetical protein
MYSLYVLRIKLYVYILNLVIAWLAENFRGLSGNWKSSSLPVYGTDRQIFNISII